MREVILITTDLYMGVRTLTQRWSLSFARIDGIVPFSGDGIRLIKSHTLATHLSNYRKYNIVMVYRNSWDCWEWWNECGGFDIAYPSYKWYRNQDRMYEQIQLQNQGIMRFIYNYKENVTECADNYEVLTTLGMNFTGVKIEEYKEKDLKVYVYQPSH